MASGWNKARAAPSMKKAGMNIARMQSIANKRGKAVSLIASAEARPTGAPRAMRAWMFSTATVASSTRMPTASAKPPSVIRLTVCPVSHIASDAANNEMGMFTTTMNALRRSRKKRRTIRPVRIAPSPASFTSALMELHTTGD